MYIEEVCFSVLMIIIGGFLFAWRKAIKEQIVDNEKSWIYRFFYSGIYLLLSFFRKRFSIRLRGDKLEQKRKLFIGKSEEQIFYEYYGKVGCMLAGVIIIGLILIAMSGLIVQKGNLIDGYVIKRDDVLGTEKSVSVEAKTDGEKKEVTITVPQQKYSETELEKKFQEAKEYISQTYLGLNTSAEQVETSLNLVSSIPNSAVTVDWNIGNDGLVDTDGSILNQSLEKSQQTEITAILSYGEAEEKIVKSIIIIPIKRTKEELFWKEWQLQTEKNTKASETSGYLHLPQKVNGRKLQYKEKGVRITYVLLCIICFLFFVIPIYAENNLQKETKKREEELKISYPDFVEHFVLLIGAGLNIKGAWERIVKDYKKEKATEPEKFQYVYEEMNISLQDMDNGMSEARAYELFGKRTGLLQYMKFCTLIVQNMRKGSDDLLKLLDYEVADAFRERKENAKALGEKAGTKLLLPMMLMLVIVFVLILYAAFQGM